jgi:hypothetical protein
MSLDGARGSMAPLKIPSWTARRFIVRSPELDIKK